MDQPWINNLPANVPAEIDPNQFPSLVAMFEDAVAKYADQPAFINMGATMTYRKLEERSRAFAAYLQNDLKLEKGDRVALMMPNLLQYPIALFGVLRAGMVVVNVNPLYTPRECVGEWSARNVDALATAPFNYSIRGRKPKIVPQKHPKRERTPTHAFPKSAKKRAWCAKNGKALPKCVPKKGKQRARVFDRSFPFRAFIEGPF